MDLPELLLEHRQPVEIIHHVRWLDRLFQKARVPSTAMLPLPFAGGLHTRVALLPQQFDAADQLVRKRYELRGYRFSSLEACDCAAPDASGRPVTLLAEDGDRLLGTLTVRPDSPKGLFAELTYGAEIARLRGEGRRVGELVRLAVEEGADWRAALDALIQSAYLVTRLIHALTDVVIEVNPRHVRFYERVFGFVVAAAERVCNRVGAPAVLLQLDVEQFGRTLRRSLSAR